MREHLLIRVFRVFNASKILKPDCAKSTVWMHLIFSVISVLKYFALVKKAQEIRNSPVTTNILLTEVKFNVKIY